MTTPHRTLQMALDALDAITDDVDGTGLNTMPSFDKALDAIATLREALNAPEPEPVAWYLPSPDGDDSIFRDHRTVVACTGNKWEGFLPLYAAPPAAPADPWRAAVLDRLAALCMDAPQDEPPESILRRIIEAEVAIALDPRVSDAAPTAPVPDGLATNADEVICPNCAHQFRAIPENVQSLLLASGHEPPFTASPAAPVVPLPRPGPLGLIQYAGSDMQEYAAAVSAAKDAEIAQLRAELIKSLADNAALRADAIDRQNNVVAPLRERVRVLEDARPEPDCRTCAHFDCISLGCHASRCDGVNMYEPLPPVRLWRTAP